MVDKKDEPAKPERAIGGCSKLSGDARHMGSRHREMCRRDEADRKVGQRRTGFSGCLPAGGCLKAPVSGRRTELAGMSLKIVEVGSLRAL